MPNPTRRCGGSASKSTSSSLTLPVAGMAPIRARSKVVLPAPLRPIRPHISPSARSSDALRMTGTGPIETSRSETLSMGMPFAVRLGAADEGLYPAIGERGGPRAVGNYRPIVEGEHTVGEPRHDLHIVFDEQHRQFPALQCRYDDIHHPEFLLDRNSAGRLVEQEDARRAPHRHG